MRRVVMMTAKLLIYTPFWYINLKRYGKNDKYDDEFRYRYLRKLTMKANKAGRVKIECYGHENLPEKDGYIIFPNHQGMFDGLAFIETCGRPFRLIMKKETKNYFMVKDIRRLVHAQLMDREDIRQSMKVIIQMAKEVSEGKNYIVFAEGTRSKKGNHIGEFKGGTFKAAMKSKCPIVPAVLVDSFKGFDTHSWEPLTVKLAYLKPMYYDEYKDMKTHEIAHEVEERIKDCIAELTGEPRQE